MKKYLIGVLAVVLAVGFTAFTSPTKSSKQFATFFFEYTFATMSGDESTPLNWVEVGSIGSCGNINDQSCRIEIPDTYVSFDGSKNYIDFLKLPSGVLPVVAGQQSPHLVPDPASAIYTTISNKD